MLAAGIRIFNLQRALTVAPETPMNNTVAPETPMNNADLIIAMLKAAGISRGFGIPSGNVLPLIEAIPTTRPAGSCWRRIPDRSSRPSS